MAKRGLYANIHAKRKRIKAGSGEKMRKVGSKGAPTAAAFKKSAKTAKPYKEKLRKRNDYTEYGKNNIYPNEPKIQLLPKQKLMNKEAKFNGWASNARLRSSCRSLCYNRSNHTGVF